MFNCVVFMFRAGDYVLGLSVWKLDVCSELVLTLGVYCILLLLYTISYIIYYTLLLIFSSSLLFLPSLLLIILFPSILLLSSSLLLFPVYSSQSFSFKVYVSAFGYTYLYSFTIFQDNPLLIYFPFFSHFLLPSSSPNF